MREKDYLRKKFRAVRSAAKTADKDRKIFELLTESKEYNAADTVFVYYSVGSEADTLKIISHAFSVGKKVALPRCTDKNGSMDFYYIRDLDGSVKDGMFSLKEPDTALCIKADSDENSLCVVPALAIDKKGYRLGYGRGYYDRFLSNFKGFTVGLCYDECLCDSLPCEEYDISLDMVITDKKIFALK